MTVENQTLICEEMTLRELCSALDVSRRTVQGYEAQGLVTPSRKTNKGYLIYDIDTQKRVRRIRQYQKYGFKIKEIAVLLDAPDDILKSELKKRLDSLRMDNCRLRQVIAELEEELTFLYKKTALICEKNHIK